MADMVSALPSAATGFACGCADFAVLPKLQLTQSELFELPRNAVGQTPTSKPEPYALVKSKAFPTTFLEARPLHAYHSAF